jgi:type IV pilus assembly protein PilC
MAQFSYKALNSVQQVVKGVLSAQNREEAGHIIAKQNLQPIVIVEVSQHKKYRGTIPAVDKITFCRYISTMLSSGLSLSEGIEVLREETKHPLMRQILGDISYSLEQGQQLSSVLARYPQVFEPYFLTLTHAGEVSGTLADIFKYLEKELHAEYSLNAKVKGALMYPAIVFIAMIGIGILMFFFVLPQIGKVFLSLRLNLPPFTRILFQLSLFFSKNIIGFIIFVIIFIVTMTIALKRRETRTFFFRLIRPIPVIRDLIKKIDLARFNRIFATLLKSAVPITEALEISLESLSWFEFYQLAKVLPAEITKGKSLSLLIRTHKVFPTLMSQMVAAGEKSGTLDTSLADLATFYEEEVEEELKGLTQIIEPVLMLFVGVAVGVMILSIIAPIYSVIGSFSQAATPGSAPPPQ